MTQYESLGELVIEYAKDALIPPERLTVPQSAEKYRYLHNPGAYIGPWLNDAVPYLVEPMELLTSRDFDSMVFVGPAQAGKTDMWLNWVTHSVIVDPMDMIMFEKSAVAARDFSHRRLDRLHRHTEEVRRRLLDGGGQTDNVFDKRYRSGMYLTLSWPSINELSGKPIPRVWFSDYDRMPQDVDGEGSPFDLGRKRTTTFGRNAMTVAESSPGFIVDNPKWIRGSRHEAPPCKGILALYNRGDRRRWYWKCPSCGNWFEPDFSLMRYEHDARDPLRAGDKAVMQCGGSKSCGMLITPEMKPTLNKGGRWVKDGQWLDRDDVLRGEAARTATASFWLKGVAAAFASWSTLVARYLQAEEDFAKTGEQQVLKSVVNTDLGEPYYMRGSEAQRTPDMVKDMSELGDEDGPTVPSWVRFLIATIDVQKNRFVVQVHGIGRRRNGFRITVVDYFNIVKSHRLDEDDEHLWVKPAAYPEDWDLLTTEVYHRSYPIEGDVGTMRVCWMGFDTGGKEGVTNNAYDYYRRCKRDPKIDHTRIFPLKGDSSPNAPRVALSFPDTKRKNRNAGARGEIPVLMFNPTLLKDGLQGMIDRTAEVTAHSDKDLTEARGEASRMERSFTWPSYLPDNWYAEMCSEFRSGKGWECPAGVRNEAWDLSYYCLGICLQLKIDRMAWDSAPSFARPFALNPFVTLHKPKRARKGEAGDDVETPVELPTVSEQQEDVADSENGGYSALRKLAANLT